jgi:hypothetical protein
MPNLVAYLHVRLNLNMAEDAEIYRNLTRLPVGERSRMVRVALLAYFKGEITAGEKRNTKRAKTRQVEAHNREPRVRTKTVPDMTPDAAMEGKPDITNDGPQTTTKKDSGAALNDLLDLIQ